VKKLRPEILVNQKSASIIHVSPKAHVRCFGGINFGGITNLTFDMNVCNNTSPLDADKRVSNRNRELDANKIEAGSQMLICSARHNLGQEIGNHIFCNTEKQHDIPTQCELADQVITDRDMPDLADSIWVGGDALTGLGIRV
jgi:hypothetical protein